MKHKDFQCQSPDYRQQYINDRSIFSDEKQESKQKSSPNATSYSNFSLNSGTITRTSFLSQSLFSLPNNDVQFTGDCSSKITSTTDRHSILIRAYSEQNKLKIAEHNKSSSSWK